MRASTTIAIAMIHDDTVARLLTACPPPAISYFYFYQMRLGWVDILHQNYGRSYTSETGFTQHFRALVEIRPSQTAKKSWVGV